MNHTTQAVAWTLIHFCWQAAAIAGIYRLLSLALARRSSNARYLAALCALLLMLASSVGTFSWEMRSSPVSPSAANLAQASGAAHTGYRFSPVMTPVADPLQPAAAGSSLANLLTPTLLLWIDGFWLLGVIVLSSRSLGGWWLIQRLRTSATVEAPAAAAASFRRIANALGLRRPALLRISSAITGPVTVGALRALVLLPLSAATSLSPEELEVVLAHELAHVRRADFFWNLVQTMVETLFFFHPAVWWIGGRIRHERELCCDDLALSVCPDPLVYARALFRLEEQRGSEWQLVMALDGNQSRRTLRMRIARILGEPLTHSASRGTFSLAAAGALFVVLLLPVPQVLASLNPDKAAVTTHSVVQDVVVRPDGAVTDATHTTVRSTIAAVHTAVVAVAPTVAAPVTYALLQAAAAQAPENAQESSGHKGDYIDRMKAAGYDVDLDKLIAMKIQDVTPEYARSMAQLGFGKLTADQLIACKIQDVTAEYIAQMKAAGYDADVDKYVAMKIQDVTPEYARAMAQLGFGKLNADELISAKIQDVTADYIANLKRDGLEVKTIQDAISYRIFDVTPEFVAQMKAAGFDGLTHEQLMALRSQDVTPEYANSIRQQFPGATVDDIVKTRIFNIDAAFIASAKRHGFADLNLEKLVKLRISGILDDNESESK
jgi:beta-lactamase regulating signal transducer with metallopeptidase domain